MQIGDLTQTLATYSQAANGYIDLIATALRPIGLILIAIFFILELNNWQKILEARGQSITKKLWVELAVKYVIAVVLVMASDVILDAIFDISNVITKVINKAVPLESYTFELTNVEGLDWFNAAIISLFGTLIQFIANIAIIAILFLRFIELYLLKAIAPVIIAFFMSDAFRSIAVNFFKTYGAYTLTSAIILILTLIFNALISGNALDVASAVTKTGDLGTAYASLLKGVIFIVVIVSVTKKTKSMLGAS